MGSSADVSLLHVLGDTAQQKRGGLQIPVGTGDIDVSEISRQTKHVPIRFGAGHQFFQRPHGKRVS